MLQKRSASALLSVRKAKLSLLLVKAEMRIKRQDLLCLSVQFRAHSLMPSQVRRAQLQVAAAAAVFWINLMSHRLLVDRQHRPEVSLRIWLNHPRISHSMHSVTAQKAKQPV